MTVLAAAPAIKPVRIGQRLVGDNEPPFMIAEISVNPKGSLEDALCLVDNAAQSGVDAIKLRTFTADPQSLDLRREEFVVSNPDGLSTGLSAYEFYQQAHTPWDWHAPITARCREKGLQCLSAPFDPTSVDFLEESAVSAYEVASFEVMDIPLIQKTAATGKPLILSTGTATMAEIEEAVQAARDAGCRELVLLKCTSNYPAEPTDSNLRAISCLRERFHAQAGLSDHTLGIGVAIGAIALGATVIEKYFTLSRADRMLDTAVNAISLEPQEMKQLVEESRRVHQALGDMTLGPSEHEPPVLRFRRSLYAVADIAIGEAFTFKNVRPTRPGMGMMPKDYKQILGRKATRAIKRGEPLDWSLIGKELF